MFKASNNVLGVEEHPDIFYMQDELFNGLTGENNNVLTQITDVEISMENLTKSIGSGAGNYKKNNKNEDACILFKFKAINDDEIYGYFPTEPISDSTVDVYVNEKSLRPHLDSDHLTYYDILNLGSFEKGEEVTVKFVLQEDETNFETQYFYALNMQNLERAYNTLSKDPMDIEIVSQRHIKASVKGVGANQLVFTTIPYDKGWQIYVDGTRVEANTVLNTLLAIPVGEGDHEIEMKYTPPGFKEGLIISGFCLVVFLILFIWQSKDFIKNLNN